MTHIPARRSALQPSEAAPPAAGAGPGALRLSALGVERGGRRTLTDVSLDLPAGAYTCVLGTSGSGKTTLLSAIAGILPPVAGRVEIDGQVLSDADSGVFVAPEHRRLGMVFQDYLLWPHLNALENVALPLRYQSGRLRARESARDWLALVGLEGLEGRRPAELSGGQQQRVALARALAVQPRLVLLDEPLSALDVSTREELRELLRRLSAEIGFSALHVTHDAAEAFALGQRLIVLSGGRVAQIGSAEDVFARPATPEVAHLTGMVSLVRTQVVSRDAPAVLVRFGDAELRVNAEPGVAAGGEAWLVLRPYALTCRAEPGTIRLRARLLEATYRGDRWQIDAEVARDARVSFWHDARPEPEFDVYLRSDRVWALPKERGA